MKKCLDLTILVDRSGSMESIKKDMEGGFAKFIDDQRHDEVPTFVTLVQFDNQYEPVYTQEEIKNVPKLKIEPRGSTALFDAVGRAMEATGSRLRSMPEHERPNRVLFMVITDGQENSSKEYTGERIREMIEHQKNKYSWELSFVGCQLDDALSIGISSGSSFQYTPDTVGVANLWAANTRSIKFMKGAVDYQVGNFYDANQASGN